MGNKWVGFPVLQGCRMRLLLVAVPCLLALVSVVDGAKILSLLHSWDRDIDQDFKHYYSNVSYDVVLDAAKDDVYIVFAGQRHHWTGNVYLKSCIKESKRIKNDTEYQPSLWTLPLAAHVFVSSLLYDDMPQRCWPLLSSEFHKKKFSQTGQDGVLEFVFYNIGVTNRYYVEFGFPNVEGGTQGSNTANLRLNHNFTGLLMDRDYSDEAINLHKERITAENIILLFEKYNVPIAPDYVSIDIDSTDLWVFRSIVRSALNLVAKEFNYTLVSVLPQTDVFYIRNEELRDPALVLPPFKLFEDHFGKAYLKRCGLKYGDYGRQFVQSNVIDYSAWRVAGNVTYAKTKAQEQLEIMRLYQNIDII